MSVNEESRTLRLKYSVIKLMYMQVDYHRTCVFSIDLYIYEKV